MWVRFGDVPTWLAATGTVGALWYTAVTFRRDREDRAAGDARLVGAWIDEHEVVGWEHAVGGTWAPGTYPAVIMRNGGWEPVYEVVIEWKLSGEEKEAIRRDVLAPGSEDHETFAVGLTGNVESIRFRDTANRVWTRDRLGVLKQIGSNR